MTGASEEPTYEFDVAVSFAGEDRELVKEIVSRLKDAGKRVFYDADYQSATWNARWSKGADTFSQFVWTTRPLKDYVPPSAISTRDE